MFLNKKISFLVLTVFTFTFISQAAIPTGYYYFARGKRTAELKTTLSEISSPLYLLSYGSGENSTWSGFYKTDRNTDNTVVDMYSDITRSFSTSSVFSSIVDMAIEHSFPKSWWGGYENYAYKDLFHLYPADSYTNGIKNNWPLGEVTGTPVLDNGMTKVGKNGFGDEYAGNSFEPADEFKGDFARSYLYIATIYEKMNNLWNSPMLTNTTYPVFTPWAVDLLLKWHRNDPVSEKELTRNDAVYLIQGNRNPFIDHPELVEYIWGNKMAENFAYPDETGAFLLSPRRKFELDFGVIFQNVVKTISFDLKGVNISSPINITLAKGSSFIQILPSAISETDVISGIRIEVKVAPTESGLFTDALIIDGGGLSEIVRVPIKVLATSEFITTEPTDITPVGGVLHWLEDPNATDYTLSLYQGDTQAGDLIISGYYEGASNDKAIEIFNGTGAPVDLSKYSLKKQTNGAGDFVVTQKLSGILAPNQSFNLVHSAATNANLRSKADIFVDSLASFNGNDAIALFRSGVQIDIVGKLDGGADYLWGLDKILKRNANITHPTQEFNLTDWIEYPFTDYDKFGTHTMNLASSSSYIFKDRSVGNVTNYFVDDLFPQQNYTYSVSSIRNGATIPSVNTQWLSTTTLDAPVILEASDVNATSFTANWEESPYASGYYLDVFQLSGQKAADLEEFNSVGANGKPLPSGWSGTASGNYTSTASSGLSPNSIALKNTGEWLQTPTYDDLIASFSYMYRFPSSGINSYFKLEASNGIGWIQIDSIPYVNTAKTYPNYNFSQNQAIKSIRFTYYKSTGNLAIDDVAITHGQVDTTFISKDRVVSGNHALADGLIENNEYFYRLKANLGSSFSEYSDVMPITVAFTGVKSTVNYSYKVYSSPAGIHVAELKGNENIRIYSTAGVLLNSTTVSSDNIQIPLNGNGVFIVQVLDKSGGRAYKVVK